MFQRRLLGAAVFCGLTLWAPRPLPALDPDRALAEYVLETWQGERGLPHGMVRCVAQSRQGYLWLGGLGGLVRFDGVRFVAWGGQRPPSLRHQEVQSFFEDSQGFLWLGLRRGGVARFRLSGSDLVETPTAVPPALAEKTVWSIREDRGGAIWLCTEGGLFCFRHGAAELLTALAGLASDETREMFQDPDGSYWIATDAGLSWWQGDRRATFTDAHGLPSNDVRCVLRDRAGGLWVGTHAGLAHWHEGRTRAYTTRDGLASNFIRCLLEDRDGNLWIGTDGGLVRFNRGGFQALTVRDGLTHNLVLSLHEDREGSLWVGTRDGLTRLKDAPFVARDSSNGLADDNVRAVVEDAAGALWIGTSRGLTRLRDGHMRTFTRKDGLPSDSVLALAGDGPSDLWIGTAGGGLARRRNGRFFTYTREDGLPDNMIRALEPDGQGGLWIGTNAGGLGLFRGGRFTTHGVAEGLASANIFALTQGPDGALWIGTDRGGLRRLRDGRFTAYGPAQGLSSERIRCLHADAEGGLWIGTRGGGLNLLKGGRVTVFTTENGLLDDFIGGIVEDEAGYLWLATSRGISRVSRRELEEMALGRRADLHAVSFGKADGMKSAECTGASQPTTWKARDGTLWFATAKGVASIRPDRWRRNTLRPPVTVEDLVVDGRVIDLTAPVAVPAGSRRLEFRYAGLSLLNPEKVLFRYWLDGFDGDWIDAGQGRVAHYTNLPPRSYTFRVIACNNDGVWNDAGAELAFRVRPRFHQTVWFWALVVTLVAASVAGVQRLRIREVAQKYGAVLEERARIARELHDTLQQGLTAALFQVEAARLSVKQDPPVAETHLEAARDVLQHGLAESRRSVQDLRSPALVTGDLEAALWEVARQLTAGTPVRADVRHLGPAGRLPARVEGQLLRIGQEAIANAVEHGSCRRIEVELEHEAQSVCLKVKDDGRGFDATAPSTGEGEGHYGLVGMKERARALGGELQVSTAPGRGTEITVRVPLSS